MDHPYAAGAVIGVAGGAIYAGGALALGGSYVCGALCGSTAATVAATAAPTATAVGTQADKVQRGVQQSPQVLGKIGETASGLLKNITRIPSATGTANYRIPDGLDSVARVVSEVKNVTYQSYTNQIKDSLSYAQRNGYRFDLITRSNTQLSGPLRQVINSGQVLLKYLPSFKK